MLREKTTHAALTAALQTAVTMVADGYDTVAVAALGTDLRLHVGHDYWTTDLTRRSGVYGEAVQFESAVAADAALHGDKFGALVVPVIYRDGVGQGATFRNPRKEIVDGENHMLFAVTWDVRDGFDVHRLIYTRRPNGDPVLGDTETLCGATRLPQEAPGSVLIQSVLHPGGSTA